MYIENQLDTEKINTHHNESERQARLKALLLLISSLSIFLLTAFGFFDWMSTWVSNYLLENLGYTNKWSTTYGPEWFIGLNRDIAALAGLPVLLMLMTIIILYYNFREESKRLWRLVIIMLGGGLILFFAKYIFAENIQSEEFNFFNQTDYKFPSGHAMMGTIFYLTLAVTISRRKHSHKTKKLILISSVFIILIIGITRVLPGIHTLKDVIAGWSLGLTWLCLCWILERKIKNKLNRAAAITSD